MSENPIVQSDKQQRMEGTNASAQRKAALQVEALHRLARRRATEGSAGGFFDRQDAQDRNQWDSDDEEFDEFGRRKKRRKDGSAILPKKKEAKQAAEVDENRIPTGATRPSVVLQTPNDVSAVRSSAAVPVPIDGERIEGVVRWYESTKAFGFVRTPGIDVDIYFKDQDRTLAPVEGMRVTFILKRTPDGKPQARNVMRGTLAAATSTSCRTPTIPGASDQAIGQFPQVAFEQGYGDQPGMDVVAPVSAFEAGLYEEMYSMAAGSNDFGSLAGAGVYFGQVKSYTPQKGFGFISSGSVDGDIYFRGSFSDIRGKSVSFILNSRGGRNQASNVEVLD